MNAGLAIIGAAAGFIVYKHVSDSSKGDAAQPAKAPKQPFWNEWFDSGDQPATANGGPTTQDNTGRDVANVVTGVAKFGTSLLEFIGAHGGAPDENTVNSGTLGSAVRGGADASGGGDDAQSVGMSFLGY